MRDRICLVTGASSGIGLEIAKELARRGARLRLVGRHPERTQAAFETVRAHSPHGDVVAFRANFSSLASVRELAQAVHSRDEPLHVLVNNAGVWHPQRRVSADGYEDTFAVNYLAPFLLTHLLLPRMLGSDGDRRIVHVSSRLHEQAGLSGPIGRAVYLVNVVGIPLRVPSPCLDLDDLPMTHGYRGLEAYARSKLAQILFSNELARRLGTQSVCSNAVHPGSVATNVTRDNFLLSLGMRMARPLLRSPAEGAATPLYVASAPELVGVTGEYFADCRTKQASPAATDTTMARQLWDLSLKLVGLRSEELAPPVRTPAF